MSQLGFTSSHANPDVWFRQSKQTTGEEYYEFVLLYVDDVLCISDRAEDVLQKEIGQHFILKEESIGKPTQYLGGKLREVTLENGVSAWAFRFNTICSSSCPERRRILAEERGEVGGQSPNTTFKWVSSGDRFIS